MSDRNARCVQCSATLVPCATKSFVETWAIAFSCSVARRKYQSAGCLKQVPYFGPPKPKPKAKPGRLPSLERPTSAPSATAGGEAASPIYKHSFAQMISRIVVCAAGGDAGDDAAQEEKERQRVQQAMAEAAARAEQHDEQHDEQRCRTPRGFSAQTATTSSTGPTTRKMKTRALRLPSESPQCQAAELSHTLQK